MKIVDSEKIRNVAILGQSGSGKSVLTEAVLFTAGMGTKISKPSDDSEITSTLGLYHIYWNDFKYNFLDTPGYFDFEGEVVSALAAANSAVIMVDATSPLQVGTDKALEQTDDNNMPRFIFVNKIDSENADFDTILKGLREKYGKKIAPFQVPWGKGDGFKGYINVVTDKAREYNGIECVDADMPSDMGDKVAPIREMLMESVAETDDKLLDKFFEGEPFTAEEIETGLREGVICGDIIPVLCGSTAKNIGIHTILNMIGEFMPSPVDRGVKKEGDFKGFIFKTLSDPFIGRISYLKIRQGSMKPDMILHNLNKDEEEKIAKIYSVNFEKLTEKEGANAGDIIAITKLGCSLTGDTLSAKQGEEKYEELPFPRPQMMVAIAPKNRGDEDKIISSLARLKEEDPTFDYTRDAETAQTIVGVQGEIHISSIIQKLKSKFGVEIVTEDLIVPYRETISGKSDVQGKHKKQSGGHGQYGDVKIRFEPSEQEFEFTEELFGGSVPKSYVPAVEKGLIESMEKGVLAGYPVTHVKATLYDGSYHDVDSSEMAFKIAANIAFKKGMEEAKPVLLEPVMSLKITVPDEYTGDIMGDISKKRGRVLGMEVFKENKQIINAEAPQAEIFKYAIDLKSMTQGMGYFEMEFARYEKVPEETAQKIIDERKTKE